MCDHLAAMHGEPGSARRTAERLWALLKTMDLPAAEARLWERFACQVLAFVAQAEGRLDDALAQAQRAVGLCRERADPSLLGDAWRVLGSVHEKRGESENARLAYTEAIIRSSLTPRLPPKPSASRAGRP